MENYVGKGYSESPDVRYPKEYQGLASVFVPEPSVRKFTSLDDIIAVRNIISSNFTRCRWITSSRDGS